ncbi:fluoride efflux transporter CrcB [Silvibacterium sp.]|uniref:fluoride efflux transporter CrcB n=1 Tax=Silvibacterium sp. TaxID=1964179 RepID=UPI0039E470D1
MKYLWIALGGALGSLARYLVGLWIYERMGTRFPYGTFVINLTGCFLIGFALTYFDARMNLSPAWRMAIPVGFIGAYTTFSTFEYETLRLAQNGQAGMALLYIAGSVILGYAGVWLGTSAANYFAPVG